MKDKRFETGTAEFCFIILSKNKQSLMMLP
jgi:hypothetical protein